MFASLESLTSVNAHSARSTTRAQRLAGSVDAARYDGCGVLLLFGSRTRFHQGDMYLTAAGHAPMSGSSEQTGKCSRQDATRFELIQHQKGRADRQ